MNKYEIKYVDKEGDMQDYEAIAKSMAHASYIVNRMCPDCRRVTSITEVPANYE